MRTLLPVSFVLASSMAAGCSSSTGCVVGASQACACVGGGYGAVISAATGLAVSTGDAIGACLVGGGAPTPSS